MKKLSKDKLLKDYIFYDWQEINDWIKWDKGDYHIEEKDGYDCYGSINGEGLSGKEYIGYLNFEYEGGGSWSPNISSISQIEEV